MSEDFIVNLATTPARPDQAEVDEAMTMVSVALNTTCTGKRLGALWHFTRDTEHVSSRRRDFRDAVADALQVRVIKE